MSKGIHGVLCLMMLWLGSVQGWAAEMTAFPETPESIPGSRIDPITLTEYWLFYRGGIQLLSGMILLLLVVVAYLLWQQRKIRLVEKTLRRERQHLADVIDGTRAGTWEWNIQTGAVMFNERWAEMLGYRLSDLAPITIETWSRRTHPEDLLRSDALLQRCFHHDDDIYECEVRMLHRDGSWVWVQRRGRVIEWTKAGKPLRMTGTSLDISEHKHTETLIAGSEERLRTIFEILPVGIALIDRDGQIVDCNSASERMLGLSRAERLVGKFDEGEWEIFRPDGTVMPHAEYASVRAVTEQRPVQDVVMEVRTADGSVWLSVSATPLNHPRYGVVMAYVDVTEQRQSETRLSLAASVFTHAREGITITDATGNILDVNKAFSEITGYAREEVLGRNPRLLNSGQQPPEYYAEMWRALLEQGHWYGEVWNRRKNGELYAQMLNISAVHDANGQPQHYVGLFTDITEIKAHQQQLEYIAQYDMLTDLPNRMLFADRLQQAMAQALRRSNQLAVVYLDLDGFKAINDGYGHKTGDDLLVTVSQRMKSVLREGDTLARLGGDEFAAILVDLEVGMDCQPVLSRMLSAAADPVMVGDSILRVSASIGFTIYPQDPVDADLLLRHADQAMYMAKQQGKNCCYRFDVVRDVVKQNQRDTLEHIRRALDSNEFVLYYQPRVNMKTGEVIGAEALIRWRHPERGLLLPGEFLSIVEGRPLSIDLGEWVIKTALAQMAGWHTQGLEISVSVNIAARQLQQVDFVSRLQALLHTYPEVDPSMLELEVLETSLLEDMTHATEVINGCRELGVHFALDDFGTGYSSLTYLKRLPADVLKIDQSFIRDMLSDPEDLAIVEGVLGLATAFRRGAVAEGVETVEHGEMLIPMGCELAQGYGIARPMPPSELPGWVQTWRPDAAWADWQGRAACPESLPMLFAIVEHRNWLQSLTAYLRDECKALPVMDEHICRFGFWHDHEGRQHFGQNLVFRDVGLLHRSVHQIGAGLLELHAHGQAEQALRGLYALNEVSAELLDALRVMVRAAGQLKMESPPATHEWVSG